MQLYYVNDLSELDLNKKTDILVCDLKNENTNINQEDLFNEKLDKICRFSEILNCLTFVFFKDNNLLSTAIISDGNLLDIYFEGDISLNFNLKLYDTRFGKLAILINSDVYDNNIAFALEANKIDLALIFSNDKNHCLKTFELLPFLLVSNSQLYTTHPNLKLKMI